MILFQGSQRIFLIRTFKWQKKKQSIPPVSVAEIAWKKEGGPDAHPKTSSKQAESKGSCGNCFLPFPQNEGPGASPSIHRGIPLAANEKLALKWIRSSHTWLVEMCNDVIALENSLEFFKIPNRDTTRAYHSTPRYKPKINKSIHIKTKHKCL